MIQNLLSIERFELPDLLADAGGWQSLDVDYEPPRVERLWRQVRRFRLSLHRIHPCEKALYHPHPWPSAVHILTGSYVMEVGYGAGDAPPPVAMTTQLGVGSLYEMIDRDGWHSVRPTRGLSTSIMLTGEPWGRPSPHPTGSLQPLTPAAAANLLQDVVYFTRQAALGGGVEV